MDDRLLVNNSILDDKVRKPLRGTIVKIVLPMLLIIVTFILCIVFIISRYYYTNRAYINSYKKVADVSLALDEFDQAVFNYCTYGGDTNYSIIEDKLVFFQYQYMDMEDNMSNFDREVYFEIEQVDVNLNAVRTQMEKLTKDLDLEAAMELYKGELGTRITACKSLVSNVLQIQTQVCNEKAQSTNIQVVIFIIVLIIMAVGFAGLYLWLCVFLRTRISKPIEDIEEWARMFRDDYCQMSPLKYNREDEIQQISDSFNIVRDKMREAQEKNEELNEALVKLNNEQMYKKQFVQKLYKEKRERINITNEAQHDGLTGLYNRRTFDDFVNEFVVRRPGDKEGTLFLVDMDNFKSVNDTLGHLAGDEALKTLAGAMRVVFPGGYLGRYGGDEFVVFMVDCVSPKDIERYAGELNRKMAKDIEANGKSVKVSVSIGAANTVGVRECSELYTKADKALYHSKENGRNQYTIYSDELVQ